MYMTNIQCYNSVSHDSLVLQYLGGEVVLLELAALSQVPAAHRVVKSPGPQFGPIVGDVDAAGSISVALELPVEEHGPKPTSINKRMQKSPHTT